MEEARLILRTAARTLHSDTLFPLLLDILLHHTVLHLDDLNALTSIPQKELRTHLGPMRHARLIHLASRREHQLATSRDTTRDYYYIHYSDAVNVIKYRLAKLRERIQNEYRHASGPDTFKCPRCGGTWKELDIVPTAEGNLPCPRCGWPDVSLNEAAFTNQGAHEKIQTLNDQLAKFNSLFAAFDARLTSGQFRDLKFEEQFARRKIVPREAGGRSWQWTDVKRGRERETAAGAVDENAVEVSITSAATQAEEEKRRERERKERIAAANAKPDWMRDGPGGRGGVGSSAANTGPGGNLDVYEDDGPASRMKTENPTATAAVGGLGVKKEEELDDKKPLLDSLNNASTPAAATTPNAFKSDADRANQALMEQYMLEMQREQAKAEADRLKKEDGSSSGEEDEDEEDEDDEFEDVPGTGTGTPTPGGVAGAAGKASNGGLGGTPSSSQGKQTPGKDVPRSGGTAAVNGLKREYDDFEESSDAATPMSVSVSDDQAAKRIKVEQREQPGLQSVPKEGSVAVKAEGGVANGVAGVPVKAEESEDDDDEVEFEDA